MAEADERRAQEDESRRRRPELLKELAAVRKCEKRSFLGDRCLRYLDEPARLSDLRVKCEYERDEIACARHDQLFLQVPIERRIRLNREGR